RLVWAQRLRRRRGPDCRQPRADGALATALFAHAPAGPLYEAVGCARCNHTGYAGRLGIHEVIPVDATIRRLVAGDAGEDAIAAAAFPRGRRLAGAARRLAARC